MANVTVEYMILVPLLILQIFLFPYIAHAIVDSWEDKRLELELEEIAGHFGSSVQQLYYTINRANISSGALTVKLDTPQRIVDAAGNYSYTITIHKTTIHPAGEHAQIMNVTVCLGDINVSSLVTLGENADWADSTYRSDKISTITATRMPNSIWLSFEEET
jgi:hypothetical protein